MGENLYRYIHEQKIIFTVYLLYNGLMTTSKKLNKIFLLINKQINILIDWDKIYFDDS